VGVIYELIKAYFKLFQNAKEMLQRWDFSTLPHLSEKYVGMAGSGGVWIYAQSGELYEWLSDRPCQLYILNERYATISVGSSLRFLYW